MMDMPKIDRVLHHLALHSNDNTSDSGLLYGRAGIAVVLARYAVSSGRDEFDSIADFLFGNVIESVSSMANISFGWGLSGICWGVECLCQNQIVGNSADYVCRDADKRIMSLDVCRFTDHTLSTGLLGLWHYVSSRIQGNITRNEKLPFDDSYLSDWLHVISENPESFPSGALSWLESAIVGNLEKFDVSPAVFVGIRRLREVMGLGLRQGLAGYVELYNNSI